MTPRVFIPHYDRRKGFDVSDLERFGQTVVLSDRDVYPDDTLTTIQYDIRGKLRDFDFDRDYLCLIGSPVLLAIAIEWLGRARADTEAAEDGDGGQLMMQLLRYDRLERQYYIVRI